MERPYKMWGYPAIPILAIISIIPAWGISILLLKPWAIGIFVGWMVLGILYFVLFRKNAPQTL